MGPLRGGAQPRIFPSCVAKRKRAEPLLPPSLTTNAAELPLNTVPVGPPATLTVSADFTPAALYSVEVFVPLFDVHHGVVGPALRPQPLTSDASARSAVLPAVSEMSGYSLNQLPFVAAVAPPTTSVAPTKANASATRSPSLIGPSLVVQLTWTGVRAARPYWFS